VGDGSVVVVTALLCLYKGKKEGGEGEGGRTAEGGGCASPLYLSLSLSMALCEKS
jgi:hypothetical protein